MSVVSKMPELWTNNEVLYKVNIYKRDWELYVEIDNYWNAKTNVNRLINNIVIFEKEGQVISCDHDLYNRINMAIDPFSWKVIRQIDSIIKI